MDFNKWKEFLVELDERSTADKMRDMVLHPSTEPALRMVALKKYAAQLRKHKEVDDAALEKAIASGNIAEVDKLFGIKKPKKVKEPKPTDFRYYEKVMAKYTDSQKIKFIFDWLKKDDFSLGKKEEWIDYLMEILDGTPITSKHNETNLTVLLRTLKGKTTPIFRKNAISEISKMFDWK